jgi:hypothetical protein
MESTHCFVQGGVIMDVVNAEQASLYFNARRAISNRAWHRLASPKRLACVLLPYNNPFASDAAYRRAPLWPSSVFPQTSVLLVA